MRSYLGTSNINNIAPWVHGAFTELQGRAFGISRIQRFMGFGYNRAAHLVDAAVELGVLTRDQDSDWLVS
ncbi:hypothetical protein BCU36_020205 [Vibrio lentus]|uniref:hypothetical protein n=1 Tax=Vibrio lentus TaxID=136468 RepID=UPI0039A629E6